MKTCKAQRVTSKSNVSHGGSYNFSSVHLLVGRLSRTSVNLQILGISPYCDKETKGLFVAPSVILDATNYGAFGQLGIYTVCDQ